MPSHEETNVRLPLCAFDALAVVTARRGISRDEAVRQLLGEHVELQENRDQEDRLTHISTVLRYPAPPQRGEGARTDRPLRLRLPPGMLGRARAVSLLLPGQSPRANRDYQARLLTDAVMTAIAVQEPFTDEFLDGLLPLLRHHSAAGLWQLAVAATSTFPENVIQNAAEEARSQYGGPSTPLGAKEAAARRRLLLVAEALEEDVAWHAPARFQVAAGIARHLLSGAGASDGEQLLYEQCADWNEMRLDLRGPGDLRDLFLQGTDGGDWFDWTGRGGAAVWRATRKVEVQDFEDWLISCSGPDPAERQVQPPGWLVCVPAGWRARVPAAAATAMPEPFATWVAAGRLLTFPAGNRQAVWPLIRSTGGAGWAPVPGTEPVLAAAAGLPPEQISGFIEAMLVDWSGQHDHEDPDFPFELHLPADKAFGFGFIDADERQEAMADAREATIRAMASIIRGLRDDQLHERAELEQAMGNDRMFGQVARRLRFKFTVARATWMWPGHSVADEALAGTRADAVQWLAGWAHKACTRMLGRSMEQAWNDAFDHRPAAHWLPASAVTMAVTPTINTAPPPFGEMDSDPPF